MSTGGAAPMFSTYARPCPDATCCAGHSVIASVSASNAHKQEELPCVADDAARHTPVQKPPARPAHAWRAPPEPPRALLLAASPKVLCVSPRRISRGRQCLRAATAPPPRAATCATPPLAHAGAPRGPEESDARWLVHPRSESLSSFRYRFRTPSAWLCVDSARGFEDFLSRQVRPLGPSRAPNRAYGRVGCNRRIV